MFLLSIRDKELVEKMSKGGTPLQLLCLKEAQDFSDYMKSHGFPDGLAKWEMQAIATYLYQTYLRRSSDVAETNNNELSAPDEEENGAT